LEAWYGKADYHEPHQGWLERLDTFSKVANPRVKQPTVWYEGKTNGLKGKTHDVLFELLKLGVKKYSETKYDMAVVVAPVANSPHKLDYRMAWHLSAVLEVCKMSFSQLH
jgi:hypothetical protein